MDMLSILGILWTATRCVSAVYDPQNPPRHSNTDPAEANPFYNITCLGPRPPHQFPTWPDWNPNTATLQEICASAQYGGQPPAPGDRIGRSANAFCIPNYQRTWGLGTAGTVAIDEHFPDPLGGNLRGPRLYLYCQFRCFCTFGNEEATMKPKTDLTRPYNQYRNIYQNYEVRIDDRNVEEEHEIGIILTNELRPLVFILMADQKILQLDPPSIDRMHSDTVSMWPGNQITCRNRPMPEFNLPPPYHISDFNSIQELCAVEWSGGHP
jgi:hypothetical protein